MLFKYDKCIEINKKEYNDIKEIYNNSTCMVDAMDKVSEYLRTYKAFKFMHKIDLKNISFNLIQAIINNYKYMKVID